MPRHVHDPIFAGRHKPWCVRELVDGPWWFYVTVSRHPMNFKDAKKFLTFVRKMGAVDDDGRLKSRDWFAMIPYEDRLSSEETGDGILNKYETFLALGEDFMVAGGGGFVIVRDQRPYFIANHDGYPWMCYWCGQHWNLLKPVRPQHVSEILRRPRMPVVDANVYHAKHAAYRGDKMVYQSRERRRINFVRKTG